jgi:6-phosphogluconolactonase (cycloisomerase 2 family)
MRSKWICYVQVSTNGEFLFEAIYGAGLARIYQLNPTTGEIERLIQELAHDLEHNILFPFEKPNIY